MSIVEDQKGKGESTEDQNVDDSIRAEADQRAKEKYDQKLRERENDWKNKEKEFQRQIKEAQQGIIVPDDNTNNGNSGMNNTLIRILSENAEHNKQMAAFMKKSDEERNGMYFTYWFVCEILIKF